MSRTASARLIFLVAAALGWSCGSGDGDWAAEVDGTRIQLAALRAAVEPRFTDEPDQSREEIVREELDRLINEELVLHRARTLGIGVSDEEVEARLKELLSGAEDEVTPDAAYREMVRREMLLDRAALLELSDALQPTEDALVAHFEAHRERYREPARVQVRQIVVEEEPLARHLLSQLRGGADFAMLAREQSRSPDAQEGGLLPPYAKGEMPEVFDYAFDLEIGTLSDVIESPYGFHVFRVEAKIGGREPEFEEMRERVRGELVGERLRDQRREWEWSLRRDASIRVNESAVQRLQ